MKLVSIVIPVYNEVDNLDALVAAVYAAMAPAGYPFELILVDDGSRDASREKLAHLAQTREWLKPLAFARNYGQSTALQAGFDHAKGDYVVT